MDRMMTRGCHGEIWAQPFSTVEKKRAQIGP
jgi:hypothetical protein